MTTPNRWEHLADAARDLGHQHRAAGVEPFGTTEHVRWDEGSAALMDALGETEATDEGNQAEREALVNLYCEALEGNDGGHATTPIYADQAEAGMWVRRDGARWQIVSLNKQAGVTTLRLRHPEMGRRPADIPAGVLIHLDAAQGFCTGCTYPLTPGLLDEAAHLRAYGRYFCHSTDDGLHHARKEA